ATYIGGLSNAAELGSGADGLLAMQCWNPVSGKTWQKDCTQLVGYTDDTLTLRANLQQLGLFQNAVRLPGSELALYTSQGLTTLGPISRNTIPFGWSTWRTHCSR